MGDRRCDGEGMRASAPPLRLTLRTQLGAELLDGAWWPYTASMQRELPALIDVLGSTLGGIGDISVNWTAHHSPPNLNRYGDNAIHG
jgi:Family of unknown function (DUF5994)